MVPMSAGMGEASSRYRACWWRGATPGVIPVAGVSVVANEVMMGEDVV